MMSVLVERLKALDELVCQSANGACPARGSMYGRVLSLGREFLPADLPADIKRMAAKQCFYNASMLASSRSDLIYVEGYALISDAVPLDIHHAWCVTREGIVIDPTWDTVGAEYFGIPFDHDYHLMAMEKSRYCSLLDLSTWRGILRDDPKEFLYRGEIGNGCSD